MFLVIRAHYHGWEYLDRDHALQLWAVSFFQILPEAIMYLFKLQQMAVSPYLIFFICILTTAAASEA
jgi:hypothetical protein